MSTFDYGIEDADRDAGNVGHGPQNPDSNPLAAPAIRDPREEDGSFAPAPLKKANK